jgi:hypothetical protein
MPVEVAVAIAATEKTLVAAASLKTRKRAEARCTA